MASAVSNEPMWTLASMMPLRICRAARYSVAPSSCATMRRMSAGSVPSAETMSLMARCAYPTILKAQRRFADSVAFGPSARPAFRTSVVRCLRESANVPTCAMARAIGRAGGRCAIVPR